MMVAASAESDELPPAASAENGAGVFFAEQQQTALSQPPSYENTMQSNAPLLQNALEANFISKIKNETESGQFLAGLWEYVCEKLDSFQKNKYAIAVFSGVNVIQMAVFLIAVINSNYCYRGDGIPTFLIAQAIFTHVWYFICLGIKHRDKLRSLPAKMKTARMPILIAFALCHFLLMIFGVICTFRILRDQSHSWPFSGFNYYYGQSCDPFTYIMAFIVASIFLLMLAVFFVIVAYRSLYSPKETPEAVVGTVPNYISGSSFNYVPFH